MKRRLLNIACMLMLSMLWMGTRAEQHNGHEYVDLGLPSGLKWATCNVGASSPEEYGDYFAWGETTPKSSYDTSNSVMYKREFPDISSNPKYDAARANWGGKWRMPTKAECEELVKNCTWKWVKSSGKNGYRVTGPNGKSIFLPAAGYRCGTSLYDAGEYGGYWSSSLYESSSDYSYGLWLNDGKHSVGWGHRRSGRSVRPVSE